MSKVEYENYFSNIKLPLKVQFKPVFPDYYIIDTSVINES